jgi:hypothetical protein
MRSRGRVLRVPEEDFRLIPLTPQKGSDMLNPRAFTMATAIGTVLQVAMVVAGHYDKSVSNLFAFGGMGISLLAGLLYGRDNRNGSTRDSVLGGLAAGALCAFIGILISYWLGDVPASVFIIGTLSSAVTGAIGGWLARWTIPART